MKNEEFPADEFLKNMIRKSYFESPSDDFIEKVMAQISEKPVEVAAMLPFYVRFRAAVGIILLTLFVLIVLMTSDIPMFSNIVPAKQYFTNTFLPYFNSVRAPIKSLFGNTKIVSLSLMIAISGGFLILLDRLLFRKTAL